MNAPVIPNTKPLSKAKLRDIAIRVRARMFQNIIMSGQDLLEVKAVQHGKPLHPLYEAARDFGCLLVIVPQGAGRSHSFSDVNTAVLAAYPGVGAA